MAAPALPKGPRSILLQTLTTYLGDINKMQISSLRKYGDTFTMPSLAGSYFLTANPEGIKTILTADPETFAVPFTELFEIFPGNGDGSLFKMIGDKHRAARKLLAPPFHGARMRAYGTLMRDVALQWARTLQPGKPFVMQNTTQAITLDIIIRAIFGITHARGPLHDISSTIRRASATCPAAARPKTSPTSQSSPRCWLLAPRVRRRQSVRPSDSPRFSRLTRRRRCPGRSNRLARFTAILSSRAGRAEPFFPSGLPDQIPSDIRAQFEFYPGL